MAGYSATPLLKKLGIKPGMRVLTLAAPKEYRDWLGELPPGARIDSKSVPPLEAVHIFVKEKALLQKHLIDWRKQLRPDGFIWVSWPKQASGIATDIAGDVVRELALPLGYVDIKVCAVTEIWSGLKLVIRKSERAA